jgi:hypothetical protein
LPSASLSRPSKQVSVVTGGGEPGAGVGAGAAVMVIFRGGPPS